jgi:hypothetical protein
MLLDDQIKEDERGVACSTHGRDDIYIHTHTHTHNILVGKHEGKKQLGRPGVDGKVILEWILGQ